LDKVFSALEQYGITLKLEKCNFFMKEVHYLGHVVGQDGLRAEKDKIKAVFEFPQPLTVTGVRSFLGMCSYYRKFIANFSKIAHPLHGLLQKEAPFNWTPACQTAFDALKMRLLTSPILAFPNYKLPFTLTTDASDVGVAGILSQGDATIAYASRSLLQNEKNYSTTEKECLAVVWSIDHFRPYLYGQTFHVVTDHSALTWLMKKAVPRGNRLARWILNLSEHTFTIEHRPGIQIAHVDALSRNPVPEVMTINLDSFVPRASIKEEQKRDATLNSVREKMEMPNEDNGITIQMENGLLYRIWKPDDPRFRNKHFKQLVLPTCYRMEVMAACHDHRLGGHLGSNKVFDKIRERFYWPNMKKDITHWIDSCPACLSKKTPLHKNPGRMVPIPVVPEPFHTLGMDLVGPLPPTRSGNRHILVITDYFTKWPEAFALQSQDAPTVAKVLVEQVISRHGAPKRILTDRGKNFLGRVMSEVYRMLGITKLQTTSYHPQTNGLTERFNKTLVAMLSMYTNTHQTDWDEHLPYVLFAYRTSVQAFTKFTPFYLLFERPPRLPLDVAFDTETGPRFSLDEYIPELKERLREAFEAANHELEKSHASQENEYNKHHVDVEYKVGDKVNLFTPFRVPKNQKQVAKLAKNYPGPFEVIASPSMNVYRIRHLETGEEQVVSAQRLKAVPTSEEEQQQFRRQYLEDTIWNEEDNLPSEPSQISLNLDLPEEMIESEENPGDLVEEPELDPALEKPLRVIGQRKFQKSKSSKSQVQYLVEWQNRPEQPQQWMAYFNVPTSLIQEWKKSKQQPG
jgi:hypothetical protein